MILFIHMADTYIVELQGTKYYSIITNIACLATPNTPN